MNPYYAKRQENHQYKKKLDDLALSHTHPASVRFVPGRGYMSSTRYISMKSKLSVYFYGHNFE